MSTSPNTDNFTLGKGVVFLNQLQSGVYTGERDLGNAPSFTFSVALEKLEHFSSRGGLKAKDKEVISQMTPSLAFTLDELNIENFSLLTLGTTVDMTQDRGGVVDEDVVANLGNRTDLAHRQIQSWSLPYDTGTGSFVAGEVVSGAAGATGVVLAVVGNSVAGTLVIARTNAAAYVEGETLTGGDSGAALVDSVTGGSVTVGSPIVLVMDDSDTTEYIVGTDYSIEPSLKDEKIGRILIKDTGSITEGETLHVTYGYAPITYQVIKAFANTQINGQLRFVSDNPAGLDQELTVWTVSLTPTGDTAMIGDDWSTLGFTGEILKDETNHPDNPYMQIIMGQTIT